MTTTDAVLALRALDALDPDEAAAIDAAIACSADLSRRYRAYREALVSPCTRSFEPPPPRIYRRLVASLDAQSS